MLEHVLIVALAGFFTVTILHAMTERSFLPLDMAKDIFTGFRRFREKPKVVSSNLMSNPPAYQQSMAVLKARIDKYDLKSKNNMQALENRINEGIKNAIKLGLFNYEVGRLRLWRGKISSGVSSPYAIGDIVIKYVHFKKVVKKFQTRGFDIQITLQHETCLPGTANGVPPELAIVYLNWNKAKGVK